MICHVCTVPEEALITEYECERDLSQASNRRERSCKKRCPAGLPIRQAAQHLVPYCFIKVGHQEARGDLFKNMRQYLDQRLTDPLP